MLGLGLGLGLVMCAGRGKGGGPNRPRLRCSGGLCPCGRWRAQQSQRRRLSSESSALPARPPANLVTHRLQSQDSPTSQPSCQRPGEASEVLEMPASPA